MHSSVISWYSLTFFAAFILFSLVGIYFYDNYCAFESMEQRHERRMNELIQERELAKQREKEMQQNNQTQHAA